MTNDEPPTLASGVRGFIRRFRCEILAEWETRARALPAAHDLSATVLVDHIPELLDEVAVIAEDLLTQETKRSDLPKTRRHAAERIAEGFDVAAVLDELSQLRAALHVVWERENPQGTLADLRTIDLAIDRTVRVTVTRFADAKARSIAAIEHQYEELSAAREHVLAKLESLLAASPVGIAFLDTELRYLRINDALAELNGKPAAEHIGRTVGEVLPEYATQLEALLRRVLATGESILGLEITAQTRGGEPRQISGNFFPVRTPAGVMLGVGGIAIDITTTKRVEDALRAERARLQSIVDHSPAAIWVKDAEGRIIIANQRLADALGHALGDVIGKRSDEILPPEFASTHQEHDRIVREEQRAVEAEEVVPTGDNTRTYLSIKFPIPGDAPLVGAIATEITDRKRMEEDLRVAVRTREDMMAVVGHDLRSPLGAVQLSATLLQNQLAGDQRARRHLEMIQRGCARIENLIDDLLDTASIRAGRFQIEAVSQSIDDVLEEAVELQRPLADERGITLERSSDLTSIRVTCDRDRVLQVFGNLIGNALKFCRAGDSITVSGARAGEEVRFGIADTGPGIDPKLLPHLFDPYWSAPQHERHGSGLGLYIVRGIVEAHGGRVWVESKPGAGSTFYFTLPIEAD
jgi:PAS domain S-box-containing protein